MNATKPDYSQTFATSRDAIASLIRAFRKQGNEVKSVGQYPRLGFSYLCSGFEYRRNIPTYFR
jgi:hypothetical protein